jgi:hypothetical protein
MNIQNTFLTFGFTIIPRVIWFTFTVPVSSANKYHLNHFSGTRTNSAVSKLSTKQSRKTQGHTSYKIYLRSFKLKLGCAGRDFSSNEQMKLGLC